MLYNASYTLHTMRYKASYTNEDHQKEPPQSTDADRKEAAPVDGLADRQRSTLWLDQSGSGRARHEYSATRRTCGRGAIQHHTAGGAGTFRQGHSRTTCQDGRCDELQADLRDRSK